MRRLEVFLFDEPLSNLDAELRVSMRIEIALLHRELGNTMVYVTHDQTEVMTLADKVVVLGDGRIEQVGCPREFYEDPANRFVAGFIGSQKMNFIMLLGRRTDGSRSRGQPCRRPPGHASRVLSRLDCVRSTSSWAPG